MEEQPAKAKVGTIVDFTVKDAKNTYCHESATQVEMSALKLHINCSGLLVRKSKIYACIEKKAAVIAQRAHFACEDNQPIAGHPGERLIFYTMRMEFHWPHLTNDIYQTVSNCPTCARSRKTSCTRTTLANVPRICTPLIQCYGHP